MSDYLRGELTDRHELTYENQTLQGISPKRKRRFGGAPLFGDVFCILKKSPVKSVPTRRAFRPRYGARNDNRESREIHEKKSAPVLVKNMNR